MDNFPYLPYQPLPNHTSFTTRDLFSHSHTTGLKASHILQFVGCAPYKVDAKKKIRIL